ncbi:MAG: MFS transporter [Nanoarchaeota archaeon]|nr:MFS transporter [Nanoarchaeota archaeon]
MGVLLKKGPGFMFTGIAKLGIAAFVVAFASALVNTVWAIYIDSFVHSTVIVGMVSTFLTFIAFCSYFISIPIIEKYNKVKIFTNSILLTIPLYILVAFTKQFYLFLALAFVITILFTLRITSFGIIVKDRSRKGNLAKDEGLLYSFMNLSWVIAPLIGGYVASVTGTQFVFLFAALFLFLGFIVFKIVNIKDGHVKKKLDTNALKNFIDFFKSKDRVFAFVLGGGVIMWFTLIYLFMPLYIIREGLDKLWIGYFLFAVSVPLIFTEYKLSKIASKTGFRKMFIIGFIFVAIISTICFFVNSIYVILGLLVLASFGMAMIEPTSEAYFFDVLKKGNASRFYGPYNTRADVMGLIARILSTIVLVFLPFKFLFILFALFMVVMVFFSVKMKDMIESD